MSISHSTHVGRIRGGSSVSLRVGSELNQGIGLRVDVGVDQDLQRAVAGVAAVEFSETADVNG